MERLTWITYQGREILYEDYSFLDPKGMLEVLYASEEIVKIQERAILILANHEGNRVNSEVLEEFIRLVKTYQSLIARTATIGLSGPKTVLFNAYLRATGKYKTQKLFSNREDALDFLVAQAL